MRDTRSFHFLWIGQTLANGGDLFYIVGLKRMKRQEIVK